MRAATHDTQWMADAEGKLLGICLGYDFCAEHEWGVKDLKEALGVNIPEYPIGLADRMMSVCPPELEFVEYDYQPSDKRRKKYKAASLVLRSRFYSSNRSHQERLAGWDLEFYSQPGQSWYKESHDLRCAWSREGFGIHVRGQEQIEALRQLYQAFQLCDIAMAEPSSLGFSRNGLSFVVRSAVSPETDATITKVDLNHKRLYDALAESGIKDELEEAGCGFYALEPDWYDRDTQNRLVVYVNPREQKLYQSGWYTLEDLRLWIEGKGPVVKDERLEKFDDEQGDWKIHLLQGLKQQGLYLRFTPRLTWMDDAKSKIGIVLQTASESAAVLPEGVYPFEEIMAKFKPVEEPVAA